MEEAESRVRYKLADRSDWTFAWDAHGAVRWGVAEQCVYEQSVQRWGADSATIATQRHATVSPLPLEPLQHDVIHRLSQLNCTSKVYFDVLYIIELVSRS